MRSTVCTISSSLIIAVQTTMDDEDRSKFTHGAEGLPTIDADGGGLVALRRIGIRGYTWRKRLCT